MSLVWDMLGVQVSIGKQSEVESVRYIILGINVETYPDMDIWEQDQVQVKLQDLNSYPG